MLCKPCRERVDARNARKGSRRSRLSATVPTRKLQQIESKEVRKASWGSRVAYIVC